MKLGIIGYGNMGHIIAEKAKAKGHEIVTVDPHAKDADFKELSEECLNSFDSAIEFSVPASAISNITQLVKAKKNVIVGTTGWYESIPDIKKLVEEEGKAFLYASNFALGVNLFFRVLENAAQLFNAFDSYDVTGLDIHHSHKEDSPSGTARTTTDILLRNLDRKDTALFECPNRKVQENELQFVSLRSGAAPGTHTVYFDSPADVVSVSVEARNRTGYAEGSILAAEWLEGKTGSFSIDDYLNHITKQ